MYCCVIVVCNFMEYIIFDFEHICIFFLGPQNYYAHITISCVFGTRPYLPDEFMRSKELSTKVDTYSFGVLLFEIATSLLSYSQRREKQFLKDHVVDYVGDVMDLKDKRAEGYDTYFKAILDIGKMCVRQRAKDRPEMVTVLMFLEGIK